MLFAELIQWALTIAILVLLFTQILVPLLRGTPFFPTFRRERSLAKELAEAQEEVRHAEMEQKIEATRRKANIIREQSRESGNPPSESGNPRSEEQ